MYSIEYDLLIHILEYYFGEVPSKIASHLLLRGPVTLHKLVSHSEYDFKIVRNTLVILIHYGIVEYSMDASHIGNRSVTHVLYYIKPENVLSILLIPFLLFMAKDKVDERSLRILFHISKYGIISPAKIGESFKDMETHLIFESISKLINEGYIKCVDSFVQHKSKYSEFTYSYDGMFDVLGNLSKDKYTSSTGVPYDLNDDQLYKINFDTILEHLLREEIKLLAYTRLGDSSLIKSVVNVLIENNTGRWPNVVRYDYIQSEILAQKEFQNINSEYLQKFFQGLSKHTDNLVVHSPQDNTYYFDWYKAKKMLKEKAIFGSIKRLLGIKGARLWNLLIKEAEDNPSVILDTHQISEKGLVSLQTARSILYNLTLKGFAKLYESVQDVTQQVPNQTDRQTLYFTSSIDLTYGQVIKLGYKFASNLIERLVYERNANFQRNLVVHDVVETNTKQTDPNIIEIHLLYLVKFIMIMRQL